jgi:hypothetical protein
MQSINRLQASLLNQLNVYLLAAASDTELIIEGD